MTYVQYYKWQHNSALKTDMLEDVLGDRGVVVLDGRKSIENLHADAREMNGYRRDLFPAYRLMKGRSFIDSQPISEMVRM